MENNFTTHPKEVVNDFIQSVVFVDDKAYSEETGVQDFDAAKALSVFAKAGKLCAIHTPSNIENKSAFIPVLNHADAIVLDWDMRTTPVKTVSLKQDVEQKVDADDEEDVETEDPRGDYACDLIRDVVNSTNGIKVIVIYTGDNKLQDICDKVKQCILNPKIDNQKLCVFNERIIIAIRAKFNDSKEQFKHNPDLQKFVVKYEDLPQCVVNTYIELTNGILSNFALKALTTIRENTPQILSIFSPLLDNGYVAHKASMEFSEDARLLLIKLFGDALSDLLSCEMSSTSEWIESWIEDSIKDEDMIINNVPIHRDKDLLKKIISSHKTTLAEKIVDILKKDLDKEKIRQIKSSGAEITQLFKTETNNLEDSNIRFAELNHHKNIFTLTPVNPVLTLGSVVKDSENNYFICIQPRCDSVRVAKKRKFLFLPLIPDGKNLILVNRKKYCPSRKTFAIQTIEFSPLPNETAISAISRDGKYFFVDINSEEYEWIVDLKALHAQRIANEYCSQLGRIGLDESEWLRLQGVQ